MSESKEEKVENLQIYPIIILVRIDNPMGDDQIHCPLNMSPAFMIREPPLSAKCVPGLGEPWLRKPALSSRSSQSYVEENYFGCAEWLRRNKDHHCGHHHPHRQGDPGGPGLLLKLQRQRSCLWSPVAPLKKAKKKTKANPS